MKRFLLLWLAGALLIAVTLGRLNVPHQYALMHRGVKACSTVTAFEANNHQTVRYSFEVDGKAYSGVQEGGVGRDVPGFSSNCAGHVVFYVSDNPHVSCIGDPAPMFYNEVVSILLAIAVFPTLALLGWRWRYPRFRRWLNAQT